MKEMVDAKNQLCALGHNGWIHPHYEAFVRGEKQDHMARWHNGEKAAKAELQEEAGLVATSLICIAEGRKENPCRREGGTWHYWRIYKANADGELKPSTEETRGSFWCTREQMRDMLDGKAIRMPHGEAGLEPVWREWFSELNILGHFDLA